jgi:hypothetical protein
MALELIEGATSDSRNARTLAVASDLAYLPSAEGAAAYSSQLGMDGRLFSVGNTQAYFLQNDEHVVVAFRGTESPTTLDGLKDWLLTDAANLLILPEGRMGTDFAAAGVGARFHQGFINALTDIWEPLLPAVEAELQRKDRPLWITGHSLGGALAVLAAWLFDRKTIDVHQVYTFGGPMVGNTAATTALDKTFANRLFRYVNRPDPVPKLPLFSFMANDYSHCQKEVCMGELVAEAAASSGGFFKHLLNRTVEGVLNATMINDLWKAVIGRVSAHLMASYRKLIGE